MAAVMRTTPSSSPEAGDPAAVEQARLDTKERAARLTRLASAPSASPKAAIIARAGMDPAVAAAGAVRTTAKSSKPSASDEQERASRQVPVQQEIARWALSRQPVISNTAGTKAPSFAYDIVRTAPKMVYTNGFQPNGNELDASRFTGKAVQFMSVARFASN